ncbi:serine hydrolase domain-containing protein [Streptomyces sp. H27-S2]|uniref:serine hydrolase domain-containing protein n=1 Tax=Streptomyces antarcticus TaxID=2996458 RepID=UPI00226DEBED|nr:serine hydrolase domain-containing protein [Streptomyces sp. H27-S2]MCY0951130.1 serine hydrolase [Streptomyces sp. H27-S2]
MRAPRADAHSKVPLAEDALDPDPDPDPAPNLDRTPRTGTRTRTPRTTPRTALVAPCAALLVALCALPPGASAAALSDAPAAPAATAGTSAPAPTPPSPVPPSPVPSALRPIDPAAFQSTMEKAAEQLMVPGAVVLLRTPQGTSRAIVGTTERGTSQRPTTADHFRVASNTKTMTAALVTLLAQDGRLRMGDPVSAYVDGVPDGDRITVAQLLKMRSGLYNYTNAPELADALDADPGKAVTPRQMLDIAFRHPPDFAPGTSYEYSNTNYVLLGLIAEKAGGSSLARQFQDRLFAPLALKGTSLPAADELSLPAPYSHGYMYGTTSYALVDQPYPATMTAQARSGQLAPVDYTRQNPSYAFGAGNAVSTADDMAAWIRALVRGEVLDAGSQKQWLDSPQAENPAAPDGQKYGYGIAYQRFTPDAAMYYHGGELPGFNSFIGHDPDNDVTLVIWTNLTLSPDGRTTAQALLPTVLNQIYAGLSLPTGPAPTPAPTPTRGP